MVDDRSNRAVARIEQALARIEGASRRASSAAETAELSDLRGKHERLKAAVQDSLAQLDQLIEGTQGDAGG